jgi:F-type H+-transporting ATPase subunit b
MPQFEISTYYSQIFWLIIVFSLLYFIVAKYVSPYAEQIFKRRNLLISASISDADNLTIEAESIKAEYDMGFKNALNSADDIKKKSLDALNILFNQRKQTLKDEIELKRRESLEEIRQITESFLEEQQASCISLAGFIIEKISGKKPELKLLTKCYGKIK